MKQSLVLNIFLAIIVVIFTTNLDVQGKDLTLDPEQTIDLPTGQMGFSLPLGKVHGVNGCDFPIALSYKAGIKVNQDASPAGLGFDYEAGLIVKKTVYVPDDNHGGSGNYFLEQDPKKTVDCDQPTWYKWLNIFWTIVSIVDPTMIVGFAQTVTNMAYNPGSYKAVSGHEPVYSDTRGYGFFRIGKDYYNEIDGATRDLPDIYFVDCPYVKGCFSYVGSAYDPRNPTGHFVFSQTGGSGIKGNETVKINRVEDASGFSTFIITLANGTRIFFEKHDDFSTYSTFWAASVQHQWDCCYKNETKNIETVPQVWKITKVLYPDYVDGGSNPLDPIDSKATNKGGWICFDYTTVQGAFRKPWMLSEANRYNTTTYTCIGYDGTTKLNFLNSITTNNETAKYNYTFDSRLDDLWFSISNGTSVPKQMPVLDSITIKTKDGNTYRRIQFNTQYDQRPNTFSSFVFSHDYIDDDLISPTALPVSRLTGNTDGRSLTLTSLNVWDRTLSMSLPVHFYYDKLMNYRAYALCDDNTIAHYTFQMDPNCSNIGPNNTNKYWYIEQKDVWDYFRQNIGTSNDFNPLGTSAKVLNDNGRPWAAAWSITKVTLPNGSSIAWDYEPNRYDRVNGVNLGTAKCGDGIRVKTITASDGLDASSSKPVTYSYFYTSRDGKFDEGTGGCSGYATAEPFDSDPYDPDPGNSDPNKDYRQNDLTKGGLYIPASVAYEKIQVVKNYKTNTPDGYAVYDFTHSGDPLVSGYYPNGGKYGDVDSSWKRGQLLCQTSYNSNGKIVSLNRNYYSLITQSAGGIPGDANLFDSVYLYSQQFTAGWVRIDSTVSILNGVKKKQTFRHKSPGSKDIPSEITVFDAGSGIGSGNNGTVNPTSVASCMTKMFGDPTKNDYVVIANHSSSAQFYVTIGTDIESNGNPINTVGKWTDWSQFSTPMLNSEVVGADFWDVDGNNIPDLIIVINCSARMDVIVIHDVDIVNNKITSKNCSTPNSTVTRIYYPNNWLYNSANSKFVSCVITNLNKDNSNKPDILLMDNYYANNNNLDGSIYNRKFYCFTDFVENNESPLSTQFYKSANSYNIRGLKMCLVDYEKDRVFDDLLLTGPDLSGGISDKRPFSYTVMKSVHLNPNGQLVEFGDNNPILKPDLFYSDQNHFSISQFRLFYTGAFYDADQQRLVFPFYDNIDRLSANDVSGFQVIQYSATTVPYDIDGQPDQIIETNSDGKQRVTQTIPAYIKYPNMRINDGGEPHMLTQPCQKKVYIGPEASGSLLRECWLNISGTSVDDLRPKLGNKPDGVEELSTGGLFDCPAKSVDNYGERISGYITAPATGNYTFWISSDDNSELWLSTDENPCNAKKIANIAGNRSTNHNIWNVYPSQQSQHINLVGNQRYYIEALHKKGVGSDNLSVGWQGPGITGDAERPIPLSRLTPIPTPKNVIASQATTWSLSTGAWRPGSNYSWNTTVSSSNVPDFPLVEFNFASPSVNDTKWQLTSSIEKYDAFGAPLETKNAKGVSSTTVYRNDVHHPIGSISNANSKECGIFTCDYEVGNHSGYWDYENGWEKGSTNTVELVSGTNSHFGSKAIHVIRDYAAGRNNRIYPGKAYRMSAWVKVTNGTIQMATDFRYSNSETGWPAMSLTTVVSPGAIMAIPVASTDCNGKWKLMTLDIPASVTSQLPATISGIPVIWYARAWIGNDPAQTSFEAFVDDIRFQPTKSLSTTTYYDSKWLQPILSVDANGNPGIKVEYDDFGRPVKWWKVNSMDPSTPVLLKKQEYLLISQGLILTSPTKGGVYLAGTSLPITFTNEMSRTVDVFISNNYGVSGTTPNWGSAISRIQPVPGKIVYTYNYTVPNETAPGSNYAIKIQDVNDTKVTDVVGPFTISKAGITSPAEGSHWVAGIKIKISWAFVDASTINLSYSTDGINYTSIATVDNSAGTGEYNDWIAPSPQPNVIIRMTNPATGEYHESGSFSIENNIILKWVMGLMSW